MTETNTPSCSPADSEADRQALHDEASMHIGRMILAFSKLKSDICHCLRSLAGVTDVDALTPLFDTMMLKQKLSTMRYMVQARYADQPDRAREFLLWQRRAERMRVRRNALVHGYWSVEASTLQLSPSVHCATAARAMDGSCFISALRKEVECVAELSRTLDAWRKRWAI